MSGLQTYGALSCRQYLSGLLRGDSTDGKCLSDLRNSLPDRGSRLRQLPCLATGPATELYRLPLCLTGRSLVAQPEGQPRLDLPAGSPPTPDRPPPGMLEPQTGYASANAGALVEEVSPGI